MRYGPGLKRRKGLISVILLGGMVAAALYYGAVLLLLGGVRAMPETPPQTEATAR